VRLDRDRFIELVAQWADIGFDTAERATRATLETLGARIDRGEAQQIAAMLPPELAPFVATDGPAERFDVDEFLRRVAEREGGGNIDEIERHVRAVFDVLREVLEKEFDDLTAELPKDYEAVLPGAPARESASADLFLSRVSERTGLDPDDAERATEAVLETLAERIAGGEVRDLISRLPARFHEPLKRGDANTSGKAVRMSIDDFVGRVAGREQADPGEARDHVRAVMKTLRETIGQDEWTDLTDELPREYDPILAS
jgi:uncharacterized protein (DUF2267 family)